MEQKKAFFLSSYLDIQLPLWVGVFGLDRHSCRGSRISPVFVSHCSLPMASIVPLFWTPRHGQRGQPTRCIPAPHLWEARGCSAPRDGQSQHCVRGRVDKHAPLWVHPHINVFVQETRRRLQLYVFRLKLLPLLFIEFLRLYEDLDFLWIIPSIY